MTVDHHRVKGVVYHCDLLVNSREFQGTGATNCIDKGGKCGDCYVNKAFQSMHNHTRIGLSAYGLLLSTKRLANELQRKA